jgi:hypothetical protein
MSIPLAKINHAASTQNFFRNSNLEDRIALQSQPLSNNYTGSAKGLVGTLTPLHFQTFDIGRDKYATMTQAENCQSHCMENCLLTTNNNINLCQNACYEKCIDDTTKDFI